MSFGIAFSGLDAAQSDLNVTSNNIANADTTGFKVRRREFSELYASSQNGVAADADRQRRAGAAVAQEFSQGDHRDHRQQPESGAQRQRLLHRQQRRCTVSTRAPADFRPTADG